MQLALNNIEADLLLLDATRWGATVWRVRLHAILTISQSDVQLCMQINHLTESLIGILMYPIARHSDTFAMYIIIPCTGRRLFQAYTYNQMVIAFNTPVFHAVSQYAGTK